MTHVKTEAETIITPSILDGEENLWVVDSFNPPKPHKSNHKEMEGRVVGSIIAALRKKRSNNFDYENEIADIQREVLDRWQRRYGLQMSHNSSESGGVVYSVESGDPTHYYRGPDWRNIQGNPLLTKSDIRKLYPVDNPSYLLEDTESGMEIELIFWNPATQDYQSVTRDDSGIITRLEDHNNGRNFTQEPVLWSSREQSAQINQIKFSAEMTRQMMELNLWHSTDPIQNGREILWILQTMNRFAREEGLFISPFSNFCLRRVTPDDIDPDGYVQRIFFEHMRYENARHFTRLSVQSHVTRQTPEASRAAINDYQGLTPYLYGLSQADPYLNGTTEPNLFRIYHDDDTEIRRLQDTQTYAMWNTTGWQSVGYSSRVRGSHYGGVHRTPLPVTQTDYYEEVEASLTESSIGSSLSAPTPARAGGRHHATRDREDIGPYGTVEPEVESNWGLHPLKLATTREFNRVLFWKLQIYHRLGMRDRLTEEYPTLFPTEVKEKTLREDHLNNLQVSKDGTQAKVTGKDGMPTTAREQVERLIDFVNRPLVIPDHGIDYQGLPAGIIAELNKSMQVPDEELLNKYRDEHGVVVLNGFYETGIGTFALWALQRNADLRSMGMPDSERLKNCHQHGCESWSKFIAQVEPEQIDALFV